MSATCLRSVDVEMSRCTYSLFKIAVKVEAGMGQGGYNTCSLCTSYNTNIHCIYLLVN